MNTAPSYVLSALQIQRTWSGGLVGDCTQGRRSIANDRHHPKINASLVHRPHRTRALYGGSQRIHRPLDEDRTKALGRRGIWGRVERAMKPPWSKSLHHRHVFHDTLGRVLRRTDILDSLCVTKPLARGRRSAREVLNAKASARMMRLRSICFGMTPNRGAQHPYWRSIE